MVRKRIFGKCATLYGHTILAAILTLTLSGCGSTLLAGKSAKISSVIWQHRDQYVRIETQGQSDSPPPANDHPAILSAERIRNMLGALDVKFAGQDEPIPLFTSQELEILGDALSKGLAQAGSREDVTFAIAGIHRELISFSTDRATVTGRIFLQAGKLNLIVGDMHEPYVEGTERRLYPLQPGSRKYTAPDPRQRAPRQWKPVPVNALTTPVIAGIKRHDWLVLDLDPELWKAAIAEKKEAKETAKAAFREASQVREESAQLEAEQQELRAELREMKQTIEQMKQGSAATAPTPAVSAPAPSTVAPAAPSSLDRIEQRLEFLQRLKSKGLISDEEFRTKKQEILDSL